MAILNDATIASRLEELVLAPINSPEILPSLLPLILGWLVIELYFGKYKTEDLGWNTSVGNAVLWVATGINLLITGAIETSLEKYVAYFLIGSGALVGYMDFFHKWSSGIAFRASSADLIYPLAYVSVVIVKTDIPVSETVLKAGGVFIFGSIALFRIIRLMEQPARDNFRTFR